MDREYGRGGGREQGGPTATPAATPGKTTLTQGLATGAAAAARGAKPSPDGGGGSDAEEAAPDARKLERFDASKVKPSPPERRAAPPAHKATPPKPSAAASAGKNEKPKAAHAAGADKDAAKPDAGKPDAGKPDAAQQADHPPAQAKPAAPHGAGGEGGPAAKKPGNLGKLNAGAPKKGELTSAVKNPAPADASPSRTTVAVGEEVTISSASGGGKWSASASDNTASAEGTDFHWKAPRRPTSATVTFEPTKGDKETKTFNVIAPDSVDFKKLRDDPQPPAGVGMWTNLSFGPQNVNFYEAKWLEIGDNAASLEGYFKQLRLQEGRWLDHDPITKGTGMGGATNNGVDDHAFINTLPPLHLDDGQIFGPRSYFPGRFHWEIPNHYKVGSEDGDGVKFAQVQQKFSIDAAGNATVTKGAASATQSLAGEALGDAKLVKLPDANFAARWIAGEGREGNQVAQAKWALDRVSAYRANDPESYKSLIAAIAQLQVKVYVAVRCTNTYSVFTRDTVELRVTGTQAWSPDKFDLNDGKKGAMRDFNVDLAKVIDPGKFSTGTSLNYHVSAEGHDFSFSVGQPFDPVKEQKLPGSEGRYVLTTHWK